MALQQTSTWVNVKFSTLIKVLTEKQEATELFVEEQQDLAIGEAELRLGELEENCRILRESQEHIAAVHNLPDTELIKVRHERSFNFHRLLYSLRSTSLLFCQTSPPGINGHRSSTP